MDSYQYQSINLGRPSIRLLQLHKGHWSDKIQGHFINAWFDDPDSIIPYSALSYTWGYIDKVEEVSIDGVRIRVTFNLHMALRHLRSEEKDQIFWIDALCINQENVHEKIHQIRQMGDIYKKAEKVVVWLGRGTEETDLVMDTMKRLRKASLCWHPTEWKDKASGWVDENNEHLTNLREQMKLILERPWFRRIWILQEVANARRATTVHCGNRSISATIFSQFPALIGFYPSAHIQSVLDIMPGISRKESWWAQGQKLHTLLVKFRESEATDDRDMIYALLGISSDANMSNILDPKSEKSSQQVIREAISFILSEKYPQLVDDASLYEFLNWKLSKFLDNLEDLEGAMLMDAFEGAEESFLKLLIETDVCRISSRGFDDQTPVHWAVQREQLAILKMLLDAPLCSFRKVNSIGQTPLSLAIQTGNAKVVELLTNACADTEKRCPNRIDIVELLVRERAIYKVVNIGGSEKLPRKRNGFGKPKSSVSTQFQIPLSFALEHGHYDIAKCLLDHGASITNKDLSLAIEYRNDKMVDFLVEYGADIDAKTLERQRALLLAALHGNVELIGSLNKRSVALESKDSYNLTPLMLAASNGHCKAIELLLESGAELHTRDSYNRTLLMLPVSNGHCKAIELLLESGAELHTRDSDDRTPLIVATACDRKEAVELLLEKDADLEAKDKHGQTALMKAAKSSNVDILELLLQRDIDIEVKYHLGRTALSLAALHRRPNNVQILLDKGAELETRD